LRLRLESLSHGIKEEKNIVLVFRGSGDVADSISVSLFDTYQSANGYCNYINELKLAKGTYIYARHAQQMVEYEITKPLLVHFDQIFEYSNLYTEHVGNDIIRATLKKFNTNTILQAIKGLDKNSREIIIHCLPIKTADDVNWCIENSSGCRFDSFTLSETRQARQKILNAVNRNFLKYSQKRDS
jgi:hypothetical protein